MLPQPKTDKECDSLDRAGDDFARAVRLTFAKHVGTTPLAATPVGSYPVFYVGDRYVAKLFSPIHADLFRSEYAALQALAKTGDVPAPEVVAVDEVDGWSALLMTRLPGRSIKEIWPALDIEEKERLCRSIGHIAKALHEVDPSPLRPSSLHWPSFLDGQLRNCASEQRRLGLAERLVGQIPEFLATLELDAGGDTFLHTEIMLEHVFAGDDLEITGLIDFEPAMIGAPEYEFASVGLFIAAAQSRLMRAFAGGYGHAIDGEFHRRVMGYALLHRYSKLSWYLEFLPGSDSIEGLARSWFG